MAASSVNVKVAVRCRPLSKKESQAGTEECVFAQDANEKSRKSILVKNLLPSKEAGKSGVPEEKVFTFDHAYFPGSSQAEVYGDLGLPIISQALEGYNGTIFAYGQTGSGKTHTMMGTGDDIGIVPLMVQDLFREVNSKEGDNLKHLVTVSYLEIYNEVIKDLLNPSDKALKIREHPDMGIYVENLAELVVRSSQEVLDLLSQGNKVRQVAATQMNDRSSRSHTCFTIKIDQKKTEETASGTVRETSLSSKINLVDLAGSERATKTGATGDRLKEGAAINKSLSALGNVINTLAESRRSGHIPYRDSKLTRLLQESLGGNSLTVMIAAVSPAFVNMDETLSTLQYASRAKKIKNETKKNEDQNERVIRQLQDEIERLKKFIASGGSPDGLQGRENLEEMMANLKRAEQQSWAEKERLARVYEEEREQNLRNEQKIRDYMQSVKEEKIEKIKNVKRLQQEKVNITKKIQRKKDKCGSLKRKLGKEMEMYQKLLQDMENADTPEIENRLEAHLVEVERTRDTLLKERKRLETLKERLIQLEDLLTEEKAEVAASIAVLDEEGQLREAIRREERAKLEEEMKQRLSELLEEERAKLLTSEGIDEAVRELAKQLEQEKQKFEKMTRQHQKWRSGAVRRLQEVRNIFESEYAALHFKYVRATQLIRGAKEDMKRLVMENEKLRINLKRESQWEPLNI